MLWQIFSDLKLHLATSQTPLFLAKQNQSYMKWCKNELPIKPIKPIKLHAHSKWIILLELTFKNSTKGDMSV